MNTVVVLAKAMVPVVAGQRGVVAGDRSVRGDTDRPEAVPSVSGMHDGEDVS